eukprot:TRINITY_DN2493_c0_g1_i1.p1 TRINITY_DN2493_c0_g1~~TRINITY_DN2493_c0_g1_i1.p1  ORF type:complete len:534 (+),score=47.82 TRINITY_DN2493_c0_g1_i1:649-2250(+)
MAAGPNKVLTGGLALIAAATLGGFAYIHRKNRHVEVVARTIEPRSWHDRKLGLFFTYPGKIFLKQTTRIFPLLLLEFNFVGEPDSVRLVVTVEDCGETCAIEEYRTNTIQKILQQLADDSVHFLSEMDTILGGHTAFALVYSHECDGTVRKAWSVSTTVGKWAYGVQFNAPADLFDGSCLACAKALANSVNIHSLGRGDSHLQIHEPKQGFHFQLPPSCHLTSAHMHNQNWSKTFVNEEDGVHKWWINLCVTVGHQTPEQHVATLRQRITEIGKWHGGHAGNLASVMTLVGCHAECHVCYYDLPKTSIIHHCGLCQQLGVPAETEAKCITLIFSHLGRTFTFNSWGAPDSFLELQTVVTDAANSFVFARALETDAFVNYVNNDAHFQMTLPMDFQIIEPALGDPVVMFSPVADVFDTHEFVMIGGEIHDVTGQIRVSEDYMQPLESSTTEFVSALLQSGNEVEVEENTAMLWDGKSACRIVHTERRGEVELKLLTCLAVHNNLHYTLQFCTAAEMFSDVQQFFTNVLASWHFH